MMLQGKRCLIAGATSEIGQETARLFAHHGARLALVARRLQILRRLVAEISDKGGEAAIVAADLERPGGAERAVREALARLGGLDVLVSYVGARLEPRIWYSSIAKVDEASVKKIMESDFYTALRLTQASLKAMRGNGGVIILTSSTPALSWYRFGAAYSLAKLTVVGLVRAIAAEYPTYGVRAYALALGNIKTKPTYGRLKPREKRMLALESPMRRWGEPREVASVALALASDLFSYVNGQVIVVDGGTLMLS